ncbi:MAG: hypothetical protein SVZ03_15460 [Spirochaetota bacterium]|nr:hypothetical protein [Spirochaetota bacterium]
MKYIRFNYIQLRQAFIASLILIIGIGCSADLEDFIPNSLGEKKEAILQKRIKGNMSRELFNKNKILNKLLTEFSPSQISGGIYNYSGIIIYFGVAKYANADEGYGVYSGLTAIPRERWEYNDGEISYKAPFVAGWKGIYAFWFYSSTNPTTYSSFYRNYGEELLERIKISHNSKISNRAYHHNLLPLENRYKNSIFYTKSRIIYGIDFENAYGATYQLGRNAAQVYIGKFDSEDAAKSKLLGWIDLLKNRSKKPQPFTIMIGSPEKAFYWEENSGTQAICQYRWMIFLINDLPHLTFAENIIRNIYRNIQSNRDEILPKQDNKGN